MTRYLRQQAVTGPAAQARLAAARILVVGAGGLAAPLLPYLAGAGIGHIRLVDPDTVDVTNLHRQTLFGEADLGHPKVEVAARRLRDLNHEVTVEPVQDRLDPDRAAALAHGCDLVLDCADSFAASYILSDLCRDSGRVLISASVTGTGGYVGAFCGGAPSLRAVFPDLPQRLGSCATDGVLGPVVGVIASLQAQMALALLTGLDPSPLGRLVTYEALGPRFGGFGFAGAPEPKAGHAPVFLSASQLRPTDWVVDLRAEDEAPLFRTGAVRATAQTLAQPDGPIPATGMRAVLVCRSGLRAWHGAEALRHRWDGDIALLATG